MGMAKSTKSIRATKRGKKSRMSCDMVLVCAQKKMQLTLVQRTETEQAQGDKRRESLVKA